MSLRLCIRSKPNLTYLFPERQLEPVFQYCSRTLINAQYEIRIQNFRQYQFGSGKNKLLSSVRVNEKHRTILNNLSNMATNIVGNYTAFRKMDKNDEALFTKTMKLQGVKYIPLCVSTQVVSGKNSRFLCEATVVAPEAVAYNSLVTIYSPLQGEPVITEVKKLAVE